VARRGTVQVLAHGEPLRLFLIPPLFASRVQLPRMATSAIRATNARMDALPSSQILRRPRTARSASSRNCLREQADGARVSAP